MDWILIIVPFILILASQAYIKGAYNKYKEIIIKSGITGGEVARRILDKNGLNNVKIAIMQGELTDNYNPKTNTINLSRDIYEGNSIASVSVAAHECGHVLQHKNKYIFMSIRSLLVPVVNFSSKFGYVVLIIGLVSSYFDIAMIGLVLIGVALIFQLITLPTEYNASSNARKELVSMNVVDNSEISLVKSMLNAAAFTYLASFFASVLQILRLFLNINRRD